MHIFRGLGELPGDYGPTVVGIGNFDGVHRGHQLILERIRASARARSARSIAVTFEPHPIRLLRPQTPLKLITPLDAKLELLAATGIDAVLVLPFTAELSRMPAAEFVTAVVRDGLHAIEVHEGANFRFGYRAEGGAAELSELGRALGFSVAIYDACLVRGLAVSSSRIRELIARADLRTARALLGRSFFVRSNPARGRGIGSRLTVPTVNLAAYAELLPPNGVYVTRLCVGEVWFDAVSNVGDRPTFGPGSFAVESHLLDFRPLQLEESTPLKLVFLEKIREEMRWPSPEALKAQIFKDVTRAQRYLQLMHRLQREQSPALGRRSP